MKNEQFVKHFLIVNEGLRAGCQVGGPMARGYSQSSRWAGYCSGVTSGDPLFNYLGVTVLEWGVQDSRQHEGL